MQHLATGSVIAVTRLAARVMGSRCFTPPALPSGAFGTQEQEALLSEEWASLCSVLGVPPDITSRWWGLIVQRYNEPQRAYHNVNHLYELFYQFYRVVAVYNFLFEEDLGKALADVERRHVGKLTTSAGGEKHWTTVSSDFFRPNSECLLRGEGVSSLTAMTPVNKYLSSPYLSPSAVALAIFFHDVIYDPKAASGVNEESSALLFERFCRDCEVVSLANKLSLREAQLRSKSAAIAHAEIMREEAEVVKLEKAAVEAARRGELEVDSSSSSSALLVGMTAKQMKENEYYRRLDRPERLASRVEAVYKDLQRTTPMPSVTDAPSPIIQRAVEEEVMHLIRATKNHTTTSVTRAMEQVRHPAMVAVERNSELIMTWHERNEKLQTLLHDPTVEGSREAENLRHSLANLGGLVKKSLFAPHQSHCIPYLPSVDTDLGLFLDMDLSIVGVSDRARYDAYGEQIRHEYSHYPSKDFRAGRTAILGRFLSHVVSAEGDGGGSPINLHTPVEQPLFKTPLYRYWCNANARANLEREIQSLAVPELKARTITIGDVPKVLEFYKGNFNNSGSGGVGAAQHGLPSEVLSSAALSFFRMSEAEMQYLTAFNFELCLMLRVEDENEMMAFLEHERQSGKGTSSSSFPSAAAAPPSSSSMLDIAARVQEVSRTSPPIVAAVFTSLTNDPHIAGSTQRTAQDFCGQHLIVHSIVVHSYYRRRGVGSRLVRELLNKARTNAMSPPVKALVLCPEPSSSNSNSTGGEGDGSGGAGATRAGPTLMSFFERNGFVRGETQTVRGGGGGGGGGVGQGNRPGVSMVEMSASLTLN